MISALAWVPKGIAKALPSLAEPTAEELARAAEEEGSDSDEWEEVAAGGSGDDSSSDDEPDGGNAGAAARARAAAAAIKAGQTGVPTNTAGLEGGLSDLNMDAYDEEGNDGAVAEMLMHSGAVLSTKDPYLKMGSDSEDSEIEDNEIRADDLLILAARNDEESSALEVWVYEETGGEGDEANCYVHHDLLLGAFPLSVAWLDLDMSGGGGQGNLAAVSTFNPEIEIWDLDVLDAYEPVLTLGGVDAEASSAAASADVAEGASKAAKKKAKKKAKKRAGSAPVLRPGSHSDAVLSVAWNSEFRNVLASASADHTVKVWDLASGACQHTLRHHSDKVQAAVWNPAEAPVLLTGGYDKAACLVDMRTPDAQAAHWQASADVEALAWDPGTPTRFLVSTEDGVVAAYDARGGPGSAPVYRLAAHEKATSCMTFCPAAPALLATGSTDKQIKLWDVGDGQPSLVATKEMHAGAIFCAGFCGKDHPWLLGVGGAKGGVMVWDIRSESDVAKAYAKGWAPEP